MMMIEKADIRRSRREARERPGIDVFNVAQIHRRLGIIIVKLDTIAQLN